MSVRRGRHLVRFALGAVALIACTTPDYGFAPEGAGPETGGGGGPGLRDGGSGIDAPVTLDDAGSRDEDVVDASLCSAGETLIGDHCYFFTAGEVTGCAAATCPAGSTLAAFETEAELQAVSARMGRPPTAADRYYIGLSPRGNVASTTKSDWRWVTNNQTPTYSRWATNQPSDRAGEVCVSYDTALDTWQNGQGTTRRYALCERVP